MTGSKFVGVAAGVEESEIAVWANGSLDGGQVVSKVGGRDADPLSGYRAPIFAACDTDRAGWDVEAFSDRTDKKVACDVTFLDP